MEEEIENLEIKEQVDRLKPALKELNEYSKNLKSVENQIEELSRYRELLLKKIQAQQEFVKKINT